LTSSAFSDPEGDTHTASQWQTTESTDTDYETTTDDSGTDATNKLIYTATALIPSTAYICRLRHQESAGNWSAWSANDSFTTAAASEVYPNEPDGAYTWFKHDWQTWPEGDSTSIWASDVGRINNGYNSQNFELISDPSAPHGKGKSLRHKQPAGQQAGSAAGTFNLFHPQADKGTSIAYADQVHMQSVYRSHWVYFESHPTLGNWQFGDTHMRTFWWNRYYGLSYGNIGLRSPEDPREPNRYDYFRGITCWWSPGQLHTHDPVILGIDEWHHIEVFWERLGEFDVDANSRVRIWINEVEVQDDTWSHYMDTPFALDHFAMVWSGGAGNYRTYDDHIRFGDIYISGELYT
jgi:hypothetical protein